MTNIYESLVNGQMSQAIKQLSNTTDWDELIDDLCNYDQQQDGIHVSIRNLAYLFFEAGRNDARAEIREKLQT